MRSAARGDCASKRMASRSSADPIEQRQSSDCGQGNLHDAALARIQEIVDAIVAEEISHYAPTQLADAYPLV